MALTGCSGNCRYMLDIGHFRSTDQMRAWDFRRRRPTPAVAQIGPLNRAEDAESVRRQRSLRLNPRQPSDRGDGRGGWPTPQWLFRIARSHDPVTADGAKVTFSGVRVTRMPPIPTVGADEGDVAGDVAGDVGTENWLGRGARPRHGSKVPDAVTERESHPTAAVLRPSWNAGRSAIRPDGRSIAWCVR
jgi:hypothetical protein